MIILFKQQTPGVPSAAQSLIQKAATKAAQLTLANSASSATSATGGQTFQPIVILDYTRSDEQWTETQIKGWIDYFKPDGSTVSPTPLIYSLDYSMVYTHSGINYGDSLKTRFIATIKNAPLDLVTLLNIQQYASQQNITALKKSINAVIDPQIVFPSGGFVINGAGTELIYRPIIVYSTPYSSDPRRINNTLIMNGAAFDTMVMRLNFALNIDKKKPLIGQIETLLKKQKFNVVAPFMSGVMPTVDKYYAPGTVESLLREVCFDNNITFNISNNTIYFQSLSPSAPPKESITKTFCFQNYVPGSFLISVFNLNNYVSCEWEAQACDVQLFTSVAVYDDSLTTTQSDGVSLGGLFGNLTKLSKTVKAGNKTINGYRFYVQEYTFIDGRDKSSTMIKGTNNWLLANFKLDTMLENVIYKNQLGKV